MTPLEHAQNRELEYFWTTKVLPVITAIFKGRYRIPLVNDLFARYMQEIRNHYNAKLHICPKLCFSNSETSTADISNPFGYSQENGHPQIVVFIPALGQTLELIKKEGFADFERRLEISIVIGFMHEIIHIAQGIQPHGAKTDRIIEVEASAWAETCENVILPLFLFLGENSALGDHQYLNAWIGYGRNKENPQWKEFIANIYQVLA